jgi:eukaryotic-like serine/threonine-protein kinase
MSLHASLAVSTVGRYQLIAEIGSGGMSTVYLAIMQGVAGFNRLFVVKVLRDATSSQFVREAQVLARLHHPNVIQCNEVGEDSGKFFIAMEFLDGQAFSRVSRATDDAAMPLPLQLRVLSDVLAGLHYAHELTDYDGKSLGIVHRDVSPHNVIITYDGAVKLLDFGIAKSSVSKHETRSGVIKGKICYLAPEQLHGRPANRRVDIFGVGIMLWEAIAGRSIWGNSTEYDILLSLATMKIPSIRSVCPEAPEPLARICERALQPEPEDRYATALEFRTAIDDYLAASGPAPLASTAALAAYVSKQFAESRRELRGLIQTRIADLTAGSGSPNATGTSVGPSSIRSDGAIVLSPARSPEQSKQTTLRRGVLASDAALDSPWRSWLSSKWTWALGVATLGLALLWRPGDPRSPNALAPGSSTPTVAPSPSPRPDRETRPMSEIRLAASPSDAHLFLDNEPLLDNPYIGKFARAFMAHEVRAEAPGYETRTEVVVFDSDRTVWLELAPAALSTRPADTRRPRVGRPVPNAEPQPSESSTRVSPQQPVIPSQAPQPPKQNSRDIDERNPFHSPRQIEDASPFP